MNVSSTSSVNSAYTLTADFSGAKAIESQIQLLQQQISQISQSSLEDTTKEDQIAALEARIANLQQRLEIIQSRQTSNTSSTDQTSSVISDFTDSSSEVSSTPENVLYGAFGGTSSVSSSNSRLIAYA